MKLPAVWIALAFSAGIMLASVASLASPMWLFIAISTILPGIIAARRNRLKFAWMCSLCAWAALGAAAMQIDRLPLPTNHVARMVAEGRLETSEPLRWRGRLRSDPHRLPWGLRYEMDLDEAVVAGRAVPVTGGLRVSLYRSPQDGYGATKLRAGDRVEALVRARPPRNFLDAGAFDARDFMARQGIHLTGSLRDAGLLRRLGTPPPRFRDYLARIRGALLSQIDSMFAASPERAALLRAMLLGDRSFVDSEVAAEFQKTAAYHVLVVAGLHVAALAMFVFVLGRRLRLSLPLTTLATLLVLVFYLGVVEDRPPILRAALMAAVFLCSRLLFRRVELLNTAAVAALVLLFARPAVLGDASFQLSFLAAGMIAGLAIPWIDRTSSPYRAGLAHLGDVTRDVAHPPRVVQFRLDLRAASIWLADRLPGQLNTRAATLLTVPLIAGFRLWEVIVLSTAIQLGMLPVLAYYFHRVSLAGPLSNVPAVLLTGLIVPLGFFTLATSFVWARLGWFLGKALTLLSAGLLTCVDWFSKLPGASYRIPGPPVWLLISFFAMLALLIIFARGAVDRSRPSAWRAEWLSAAAVVALATIAATYPFSPRLEHGKLEVTVLDVGQGDSIFAAFPGGHTMLIDGGGEYGDSHFVGYRSSSDLGEQVVSPYLWQRGVKHLDVVALTHAHHDHLDGLNTMLENFRVSELWVGRDVESPAFRALLALARVHGVRIVHHERGDAFDWDGVNGRVLWPADDSPVESASNNDSLVIRLQDGNESYLLPGDIEGGVEEELAADGDALRAAFLKVPHHGSKTSSTAHFLASVAPQFAVISVGERNPFGHPNPDVLARLDAAAVHVLRTDRDGAVTAITDGSSLNIRTYAQSQHR